MKDKKWLKEKVRDIARQVGDEYLYINIQTVLDLIDQLDEPEVPVVAEDVYEHIKMKKVGGVPLDIALDGAIGRLGILERDGIQFREFRNNQDNYARAWLAYPNIEVEEEQKYYVVKSKGLDGVYYYFKKFDDEVHGMFGLPNDKELAYKFYDKEKAQAIANYTNSEVEELEE